MRVLVLVLLVVVVTGGNKVNSYSDQLKLCWVCKFGVEFDKMCPKSVGAVKRGCTHLLDVVQKFVTNKGDMNKIF